MNPENFLRWTVCGLLLTLGSVFSVAAEELVYYPRGVEGTPQGTPRFVVPDPDANGGAAQAAIPGQSVAGSSPCSFYAYARKAATYRITWRIKLDDNTIPGVVLKMGTGDGQQGKAAFKHGGLELKGTDFTAPGQYQEFTYLAEKGEGGFFTVNASWTGKGRVQIDSIKIVPEKLFIEQEIVQRTSGKLALPETWLIPKPLPPSVHIAKGLWWNFFGLSEALTELGGGMVSSSYYTSSQSGATLRNFPTTWQQFMACNLILLVNVDAQSIGPSGRLLLEEYVKNGGTLFVCGGPFAFEPGGYQDTALAQLLPCEMTGSGRIKAEGGFVLKPTDGAKGILPDGLSWQAEPRVFYYHEVQPNKDAQILVTAGGKPLLMVWQVGKGRVAALAATAEGEPASGQLAFWDWGDLPRLIAGVSRWLMQGQGENLPPAKSSETKQLLDELLSPALGDDNEKREKLIQKVLARCHDQAFAKEILTAVSLNGETPDRTFVMAAARAVQPFVDAGFEPAAQALLNSGNVGKAALGLQVLGNCRVATAQTTIVKFLTQGASALKEAGDKPDLKIDNLGADDRGDDQRLKLAAVIALGDLGDPANLARLLQETEKFSGKTTSPSDLNEVTDLNENILQQALGARARLGDGQAVGPFLRELLKNAAKMEEYNNYLDSINPSSDDKVLLRGRKTARKQLPVLRQRQALCLEMLRRFPYSVYPAVAAELVRLNDATTIPYGSAALAPKPGQAVPPEVAQSLLPLLENCTVPELRLLAYNLIASAGNPATSQLLATAMKHLAASQNPADVKFVLRQLGRFPAADRGAILKATLANPDPKLRLLARASVMLVPEGERQTLEQK